MRIYVRPKKIDIDGYVHVSRARQYRPIDGTRLWRGHPDIETIAGRYRPANISKSK